MANGDQPTDWDSILYEAATSPRRISVDGIDYAGRSAQELLALKRDHGEDIAVCKGFGGGIVQRAAPPNALGVHCGYYRNSGGRIW